MRARVIYNPTSGRELLKRQLPDILQVYENAGYETSAFATTPEPHSARNEAERAALAGFDLIVAAGGDGTINEVVNGIAGLEKRPRMAIIPAGTTNDFARAMRLPRNDLVEAARIIEKKRIIRMDVGRAITQNQQSYFINIGAAGLLTEVTYDVPSHLKSIFGYLAYFARGAEMLPRIKPVQMHIEYEDGVYEGSASMFFVALTNSVGGFEQLAPDAKLDDGKFTLIIVKTANLVEIMRLIAQMMNGAKHINHPSILYKKTSRIVARSLEDSRLMINLDGEYGGDSPVSFTNLHQHIELYANVEATPYDSNRKNAEISNYEDAFIKEMEELTNEDLDGDGEVHTSDKNHTTK